MAKFVTLGTLALLASHPVLAQGVPLDRGPSTSGTVIQTQPGATGNNPGVVISRGATGADTVTTNSAAGGNAGQPERAIPQGGSNGGGGSR